MALFKILRGNESKLDQQEKHDGYAYFTQDTNNFYIDHEVLGDDGTTKTTVRSLSGVGKREQEKGEIFNDYINNKAYGENTHAEGYNNIAGSKGFKILGTQPSEGVLEDNTTGFYTLDSVEGLEIGDIYSLKISAAYTEQGKITRIDTLTNMVGVTNYVADALVENPNQLENTFKINNKPGIGTVDIGYGAHVEGGENIALYDKSHAEGGYNAALGRYAHVEGQQNIAYYNGHAEGKLTKAFGDVAHAEGDSTSALGIAAHAEGSNTIASGNGSHAEGGSNTQATGHFSHAEGGGTEATKIGSHSEGINTHANGICAHAEGNETKAEGNYSHAEGYKTKATKEYTHAEGSETRAEGNYSHAEGDRTVASGLRAHAEGLGSNASANASHAEGGGTYATNYGAHAEGGNTHADGHTSHAEGANTVASKDQAHAEGYETTASGAQSHAEGLSTMASGKGSHAEGWGTLATANYQHVQGKFNNEGNFAHIVGNGKNKDERSNAHTLDWNGNAWFAGEVTTGVDKERLVTANEMYDNVNMHYIGECTQDEAFQFSKKGTVALLKEDFSYSYHFTKKVLSYSDQALMAIVDNSDKLIDDAFINQYAVVFNSASDDNEKAQSCTITDIYYESNNQIAIQFSEEIRDIDFDIDFISFYVDVFAYKDDYIVYDGHKIKILIPGPTHRNIENGDAGQHSLQQKKEVETWVSSNQYILAAMEQGLTNADQGLPINRNGQNIKVGAFNRYASMWGGKSQAIGSRAHAEGGKNIAFESAAHAEGTETFAAGKHSHSEGLVTSALANSSHAEGHLTVAKGITSHAEGYGTIAHAQYSHTEGWSSEAEGDTSHAEGYLTKAEGNYSHSEGYVTSALGNESHAEGKNTFAFSEATHSEGYNNKAGTNCFTITAWDNNNKTYTLDSVEGLSVNDKISIEWVESYSDCATITQIDSTNNIITVDNFIRGSNQSPSVEKLLFTHLKPWLGTHAYGYGSHSEGADNVALLTCSHAEGRGNYSLGFYSHTEGRSNTANYASHAEGRNNFATGDASHAEGRYTKALGHHSHAEGNGDETNYVIAQGNASHAEGKSTNAIGNYSHAEGIETKALKEASHAEGFHAEASGNYSHAEGYFTDATQPQAHAEGYGTIASGNSAHAEGNSTEAFGEASHAEGKSAKSLANFSHAEGSHTTAMGDSSHAEGSNTVATEYAQHVQGRYNYLDENGKAGNYAHIVGGGTSDTDRKNLHTLDWGGNAWFAGGITYKYPYANEFTQSQENLNNCRTPIYLGKLIGKILFDDIFDKGYDEFITININNTEAYLSEIFNPFEHYIICTLTDEMITTHYEAIASAGIAILSNGTIYIHDITDLKLAGLSELEFNIEIYYTGPSKLS